jgi:hypothetical protein
MMLDISDAVTIPHAVRATTVGVASLFDAPGTDTADDGSCSFEHPAAATHSMRSAGAERR